MRKAYINAKLFNQPNDAFIVENGRFIRFGRKGSILNTHVDEVIDLAGHHVLPGFNDSHLHVLGIGKSMNMENLAHYKTINDLIEGLKKSAKTPLIGRGYHESQFLDKRSPTKVDLNQISANKIIILYRVCGHMVVANDYAINLAKKQGTLPEDPDAYDLSTGIFKEDAIAWIMQVASTITDAAIEAEILKAQDYLLSHGITAVGSDDFAMYKIPFERILNVFKKLDDDHRLKLRVLEQANIPSIGEFQRFIDQGLVRKRFNRYHMGPLKLLADGSLGARSAYMREPYEDADTKGIRVFKPDVIKRLITMANDAGMDVAIHAIGDQMIEELLDIFESIPEEARLNRRHSIIHAQLARPDQIERMRDLKIGAQTQPIFINSDLAILEKSLGKTRMENSYLFNTMAKQDVVTTISTDAPVEDVNPFENLHVAITRQSIKNPELGVYLKEEGFSYRDAIKAYTEVPAYFFYQEDELGKLKKDYYADFIIVKDLSQKDLLKAEVLETYIEGERVYAKK